MANKFYEGGLAETAGVNLYPASASEAENPEVPGAGGSGDFEPKNGTPPQANGSDNSGDFLTKGNYSTAKDPVGMDIRYDTGFGMTTEPKIVNPDDIKRTV